MKTKLALAMCAAMVVSSAAMAAQSQDDHGRTETTRTTTTTTVKHVNGEHQDWYKEGGVVPSKYRGNTYVVEHWKTEHLNNPPEGSHWVRGDNGDFLLVNQRTGAIVRIVHQH